MGFLLGNWKMVAAGLAVTLVIAAFGWARWDAVRDERARQAEAAAKARIETLNDVREIENETRTLDDDALFDCLRGSAC